MKIGVFIDDLNQLDNWQQRILEQLNNDPNIELGLLITQKKNTGKLSDKLFKTSTSLRPQQWGLSSFLLKLQYGLEKKRLFKNGQSVVWPTVLNKVSKISNLTLSIDAGTGSWVYEDGHVAQLESYKVDLLINLSSAVVSGKISQASQYGSWALLHKDYEEQENYPVAFAEVLLKKPSIGCTLLKLSANGLENLVLDKAHFNRHWSMVETETIAREGGVSLLFKNLEKLRTNRLEYSDNSRSTVAALEVPTVAQTLRYLSQFYNGFFNKIVEKVSVKFLKLRYECWTVFVGDSGFYKNITASPTALKMPKDEFWADPFLFEYNGTTYVFFENYSYITNKGIISCGVLNGNELTDVTDVLVTDYHLSFPYMFKEDGHVYMMPETSANNRLEIYKAIDFPKTWELCVTAFEGEKVADAFFHTDDAQQKWLFLNKQQATTAPMNSELYIYKVDSFRLHTMKAHTQNPVLIDARVARNGGAIFKDDNQFFRPSQRNVDGVYGRALNINKIETLTINEYKEKTIAIIAPNFDTKLMGLHHLHQLNGRFVFDAAYRKK